MFWMMGTVQLLFGLVVENPATWSTFYASDKYLLMVFVVTANSFLKVMLNTKKS